MTDSDKIKHLEVLGIKSNNNSITNVSNVLESSVNDILESNVWNQSILNLKEELDPQVFAAYIKPLKPTFYDKEEAELRVSAPSNLVCNHVSHNYSDKISKAVSIQLGVSKIKVHFAVDTEKPAPESPKKYIVVKKLNNQVAKSKEKAAAPEKENHKYLDSSFGLNSRYIFSNYVVGNANQFCHAASVRVSENPGGNYNPLFIYGGVGLGKTHLLHAIGNSALEKNPNTKVLYMSSETFTNELIGALRSGGMDLFKHELRTADILLIDDIQFIAGKERTQEEFFHTFNTLYNSKKQIVISCDKMPHEIPGIEERLRTRFAWGLTADIQAPDFETRVAILKRKSSIEGIELPHDVASYIAESISSNVRELEGALTRLCAQSSLKDIPISLSLAETSLKEIIRPRPVNPSIREIKIVVAEHFSLKVSDLSSKRRTRNLSFPRHIAMYLCRKHTTASYPEIGLNFGGRDHSSVIHAANVVSNKLKKDPELVGILEKIELKLFENK